MHINVGDLVSIKTDSKTGVVIKKNHANNASALSEHAKNISIFSYVYYVFFFKEKPELLGPYYSTELQLQQKQII